MGELGGVFRGSDMSVCQSTFFMHSMSILIFVDL